MRSAGLVDRTFSAMPPAFVERMQQGQPQGSELAGQWEKTLLAVRAAWGELDRLAGLLRERVEGMPLPPPLPWKLKQIESDGSCDDSELIQS